MPDIQKHDDLTEAYEFLEMAQSMGRVKRKFVRWQIEAMANKKQGNIIGLLILALIAVVMVFAFVEKVPPVLAVLLIISGILFGLYVLLKILKIL
jgi:uncharacterized protein YacL